MQIALIFFNDIRPHEPPLQASSSPLPRIRLSSLLRHVISIQSFSREFQKPLSFKFGMRANETTSVCVTKSLKSQPFVSYQFEWCGKRIILLTLLQLAPTLLNISNSRLFPLELPQSFTISSWNYFSFPLSVELYWTMVFWSNEYEGSVIRLMGPV